MNRLSHRIALTVVTALPLYLLAACSERRSTGPEPPTPRATLVAMDIKHSPLAAISDTLWGVPVESADFETEYLVELTDSAADRFGGRIDDIILRYEYQSMRPCQGEVFVRDQVLAEWTRVEWFQGSLGPFGCGCAYFPSDGRWTLSRFSSRPDEHYLGIERFLTVAGRRFSEPFARLIRYRHDFDAAVLSSSSLAVVRGITMIDEGVAISIKELSVTQEEFAQDASIKTYDLAGEPLSTVSGDFRSMVWAEGRLWVIDHHRTVVGTVDSTGAFQERFTLPEVEIYPGFNRFCIDMTYGMGRLWFLLEGDTNLHGALLGPSVDSGFAVVDWRFPLRTAAAGAQGITWDGAYFNVLSGYPDWRIHKVNQSSQLVGTYQLHVRPYGPIASDGEALWIPHMGSPEMGEHVTYLSRFRLP